MGNFIDLTGQRFGKLVVIKRVENDSRGETRWLCKCDCGKTKEILSSHIRKHKITSCGCRHLDNQNNIMNICNININTYKRLYYIFNGAKQRCINAKYKNYKNYGKRGIKFYDKWLDKEKGFENFCKWAINNGYKDDLTIDRIDNNGNYEPKNCRWTTIKEQENNRRDNIFITLNNETKTLKQWAEFIKIPYSTLYSRYVKYICFKNKYGYEKINIEKLFSNKDLRKEKNAENK